MPFSRLYKLYGQIKYDYNKLKNAATYTRYSKSVLSNQIQNIQKGGNNGTCGSNASENEIINNNLDGSCGGKSYE